MYVVIYLFLDTLLYLEIRNLLMLDITKMSHILRAYRSLCLVLYISILFNLIWDYYVYLFLVIILCTSYNVFIEKRYKQLLPVNNKCVLISGCDTGKCFC